MHLIFGLYNLVFFVSADFIKTHTDLVKGYDFAIYLLSSDRDTITSSLMTKPTFVKDNALPKKYIIVSTKYHNDTF